MSEDTAPIPVRKKAVTEWLTRGVLILLGAFLSQWWGADLRAKELYTVTWHDKVDTHITTGERAMIEFAVLKGEAREMRQSIDDLVKEVRGLRDFMIETRALDAKRRRPQTFSDRDLEQ